MDQPTDVKENVWQYGKSASTLEASSHAMQAERKAIIHAALDHEIRDIRTYSGYRGDLLVEITSTEFQVLETLKAKAEELGMETVLKERSDVMIHELYCITPDEDIYAIKPRG